jgi:hypothetical protein
VGADQGGPVTRHIYTARLLPIGRAVRIPDADDATRRTYTFNNRSFEIERTSKTKPEVWIDHDPALRIGNVGMLYTQRDWWCCDFTLHRDVPEDIEFEVGQPVSVGLSQLLIGSRGTYLREISLVRRGAIEGAEITSRYEIKETPPPPPAQWKQTRARLQALGIDVSNYRPPPPLHRSELESMNKRSRAQKPSPSAWPPGTIVRDLPDGSQEITYTNGGPLIRRPGGKVLGVR